MIDDFAIAYINSMDVAALLENHSDIFPVWMEHQPNDSPADLVTSLVLDRIVDVLCGISHFLLSSGQADVHWIGQFDCILEDP